jgi:hypothetical protein
MAQAAEVLSINSNTANTASAQPGWYQRNKSWAVPTATFAGGVAVGVAGVKLYDYLTSDEDVTGGAPAAPKAATK